MKIKTVAYRFYQATLGILVEIAFSLTIMAAALAVVYLITFLRWSSSQL